MIRLSNKFFKGLIVIVISILSQFQMALGFGKHIALNFINLNLTGTILLS
jgi:hypothetical protein